jgi:hypothetical protein
MGWEDWAGAAEVDACALTGKAALLQPARKITSRILKIVNSFIFMHAL